MAATGLDLAYAYRRPPSGSSSFSYSSSSSFINSIFMSTVNVAASTLVSVASNAKNELAGKWRPADHLRFMFMLTTWVTVWALRVFMDWFPCFLAPSRRLLAAFTGGGGSSSLGYHRSPPLLLPATSSAPSSALSTSALASLTKLDFIPYDAGDFDGPSVQPLGRALSQIFAILNEMPASSRKYQFTMAMAEKIMEENARGGLVELLQVNRMALAAGFARTSSLLYDSLRQTRELEKRSHAGPWPSRIVGALPFGSYVAPYMKVLDFAANVVGAIIPKGEAAWNAKRVGRFDGELAEYGGELVAEKLAQELLWMTHKLREYGAVDVAMLQWSFASGLASVSVATNPRVQCCFVKISAALFCDLTRRDVEEMVSGEVKFKLLSLWLPLLSHARNGLAYPALMRYEKDETERAVNEAIGWLPAMDQEVILMNWLQDYAISSSEWPNLQDSYERWCHSTRELVA